MNNLRLIGVLCLSVLLSPSLHADDSQQEIPPLPPQQSSNGPEYVDPSGKLGTVQFTDGYTGQVISREQFIAQNHQIQNQYMTGTNRILGEARQYLGTASDGGDRAVTEATINGIQQSQKDVANMHTQNIAQANSLKPKIEYAKPKVLVSGDETK